MRLKTHFGSHWKHYFSDNISVLSALEVLMTMRYVNWRFTYLLTYFLSKGTSLVGFLWRSDRRLYKKLLTDRQTNKCQLKHNLLSGGNNYNIITNENSYICDNLCLAVLYVIEQFALLELLNRLLSVIQFFLEARDVVVQAVVDVFNVLSELTAMTSIYNKSQWLSNV